MTELHRMACFVVSKPDDVPDAHRLLRWLGCRGSVVGLFDLLTWLAGLSAEFEMLKGLFPNLAWAVDRVNVACGWLERLGASNSAEADRAQVRLAPGSRQWCDVDAACSAAARLAVAASFIVQRSWAGHKCAFADRKLLQEACGRISSWASRGESFENGTCSDQTHVEFLSALRLPVSLVPRKPGSVDSATSREAEMLGRILAETRFSKPWTPCRHSEDGAHSEAAEPSKRRDPDVRRWGNGMSVELPDRGLLPESLHAWCDSDRQSLDELAMTDRLMLIPGGSGQATDLRLLMSVATCTGRTLERAAEMRCIAVSSEAEARSRSLPVDCLVIVLGNVPIKRATIFWRTSEFHKTGLLLKLRPGLIALPLHCRDASIDECLARPIDAYLAELKDLAAIRFKRSPAAIDLCVKHALAIHMYQFNANRAVIRFVCGARHSADDDINDASALHHYVDPKSVCVVNAYAHAVESIHGGKDEYSCAAEITTCTDAEACMSVSTADMWAVVTALEQDVIDARKDTVKQGLDRLIAQHNAFANYTATMLVVATGHRVAERLFHFPFTLVVRDQLAFLSDKHKRGSEARWVPLPTMAAAQVEEYQRHVMWLIDQVRDEHPELASAIEAAVGMGDSKSSGRAGFLFTIRGGKPVSISSDSVDRRIRAVLPSHAFDTRAMRRNYATFLANVGVSGMCIELVLGHVSEMHPVGPGSCWVPREQFNQVRPLLERYLDVNGWQVLHAIEGAPAPARFVPNVPGFRLSSHSYEGRFQLGEESLKRASSALIAAVADVLAEADEFFEIDTDTFRRLADAATEALVDDKSACAKIPVAMADLAARWRRRGVVRVNAAAINRLRTEEGPVGVTFGRRLAIANAVVDWLPLRLKRCVSLPGATEREIVTRRLSVLAIVLVCCDGVLQADELRGLIDAVQGDELRSQCGQFHLRTVVETRSAIYERTIESNAKSSAAILGFLDSRGAAKGHEPISWAEIERDAHEVLRDFVAGDATLSLKELRLAMQPYWQLRVSGSSFASMSRRFESTAASELSTRRLLGEEPLPLQRHGVSQAGKRSTEDACSLAVRLLGDYLSSAKGRAELFETSSRQQRRRLCQKLAQDADARLAELGTAHPIVNLWLEYLSHLLEEGGLRTDTYSFHTLNSFHLKLAKWLLREAWDEDIVDFLPKEFDALYERVMAAIPTESTKPQARTALRGFHRFLRAAYQVPQCSTQRDAAPAPRMLRNVVLARTSIERAEQDCLGDPHLSDGQRHGAAGLIATMDGYGLRTMEAYGIGWRQIDDCGAMVLRNSV